MFASRWALLPMSFVFSLGLDAQEVDWARQWGSAGFERAYAISVNESAVYVAGDYDPAEGSSSSRGDHDGFLRKYDTNGRKLWNRELGAEGFDRVMGICEYANGVYAGGEVTGVLEGQTSAGDRDGFLVKFDTQGRQLWLRQFGTEGQDNVTRVTANHSGVYVVGRAKGNFPGVTGSHDRDPYVRKYDFEGKEVWTRQFETPARDYAHDVAIDDTGVYLVGATDGAFPGETNQGGRDAYVRKYDFDGTELWTTQLGTAEQDELRGVYVSSSGVYAAGFTRGIFEGQEGAGDHDAFYCQLDFDGRLKRVRQFGTGVFDQARSCYADATGVYLVGITDGAFPGQSNAGGRDAYIRKYDLDGGDLGTLQLGTEGTDYALAVTGHCSAVYVGGHSSGVVADQTLAGGTDAVILKVQFEDAQISEGIDQLLALARVNKEGADEAIRSLERLYVVVWPCLQQRIVARLIDTLRTQEGEVPDLPVAHELSDADVLSVAFDPTGELIVSGGADGTAQLWKTKTGEPHGDSIQHGAAIERIAFSPDGTIIATGGRDGVVRLWTTASSAASGAPMKQGGSITSLVFSPDGATLASTAAGAESDSSSPNAVRVWKTTDGSPLCAPLEHNARVVTVQFSPQGKVLATADAGGTARLWDATTGEPHGDALRFVKPLAALRFEGEESIVVATGFTGRQVERWDVTVGAEKKRERLFGERVSVLKLSPDGRILAGGGTPGNVVLLWDASTGKNFFAEQAVVHEGAIKDIEFSSNARLLAVASTENGVRVWNLNLGPSGYSVHLPCVGALHDMELSADGKLLVVASTGGLRVWRLDADANDVTRLGMRAWLTLSTFASGLVPATTARHATILRKEFITKDTKKHWFPVVCDHVGEYSENARIDLSRTHPTALHSGVR